MIDDVLRVIPPSQGIAVDGHDEVPRIELDSIGNTACLLVRGAVDLERPKPLQQAGLFGAQQASRTL